MRQQGTRRCWLLPVQLVVVLLLTTAVVDGLVNNQPVSTLLQQNAEQIAQLKSIATEEMGSIAEEPYSNDVFYLRYCLEYGDDKETAADRLKSNLAWRREGPGLSICQAAVTAVQQAMAGGEGTWNNEPIVANAPHSAIVSKFITSENGITITSNQGDLIYCVRAGQIDDNELMDAISVDDLAEFFLYSKEINSLVSLQRSLERDQLVSVVTVNDLNGLKLLGGSSDFRKALGKSSQTAVSFYPATYGPTLLLNLPGIVSALVKLFTPLLPEKVKERIRFEQGPLRNVESMSEIAASGEKRTEFCQQLDGLLYDN